MTGEERKAFYTQALRDSEQKLTTIREEMKMVEKDADEVTRRQRKLEGQEREVLSFVTTVEFLLERDVE